MGTSVATSQAAGVVNFATGSHTGDGAVQSVALGFTPRRVVVFNETAASEWAWREGMADTITQLTVTAGAQTADATSAIVVGENGFTFSAAANVNGEVFTWEAFG